MVLEWGNMLVLKQIQYSWIYLQQHVSWFLFYLEVSEYHLNPNRNPTENRKNWYQRSMIRKLNDVKKKTVMENVRVNVLVNNWNLYRNMNTNDTTTRASEREMKYQSRRRCSIALLCASHNACLDFGFLLWMT